MEHRWHIKSVYIRSQCTAFGVPRGLAIISHYLFGSFTALLIIGGFTTSSIAHIRWSLADGFWGTRGV